MRRLAEASGIATPTRAELARFDRSRKNFGANGQRVLDGLVGSLDREVIVASLNGRVRLTVDQLGDALRLELRETDRMLLADLLDEHDTLTRRVSEFDRYIDQALVSYAEACRLLETIPGIDRTRVLRPTGRSASAYPRNTGGIHMMNDEMCVVHARAAGLDVHVVTVTCWNWFAFAGDVAAQDGAIGRFVSIGTARAEKADPAGSVPTRSPRAEFDPHIRPLRRELDLGRPVAPPEIGCALRERTRGLQLQKRLWEIPTVAARSCPPSGRKSFVGFGDASAAIRCVCSSVPPFAEIRRDPGRPKRVVAGRRRQPRGHRAPLAGVSHNSRGCCWPCGRSPSSSRLGHPPASVHDHRSERLSRRGREPLVAPSVVAVGVEPCSSPWRARCPSCRSSPPGTPTRSPPSTRSRARSSRRPIPRPPSTARRDGAASP